MQITRTSGLGRTHSTTHAPKSAVAASAVAAAKVPPAVVDEIVSKLKAACKSQSVAPKVCWRATLSSHKHPAIIPHGPATVRQTRALPLQEVLECLVQLEKAKLQPSPSWQQAMTSGRWRLIYSAKSKVNPGAVLAIGRVLPWAQPCCTCQHIGHPNLGNLSFLLATPTAQDVTAAMKGKEGGPGRYFKTFAVAQSRLWQFVNIHHYKHHSIH
jgi:hypothetical protein